MKGQTRFDIGEVVYDLKMAFQVTPLPSAHGQNQLGKTNRANNFGARAMA